MKNAYICIVDDHLSSEGQTNLTKIGYDFDDKKPIEEDTLRFFLKFKWEELAVKNLVEKILTQKEYSKISFFMNPQFLINSIDELSVVPDIVIYDWDTGIPKPEDTLGSLLNTCYAIVIVYTGKDKGIDDNWLAKTYPNHKERICVLFKEDVNSHDNLISSYTVKFNNYFSFRYGRELRKRLLIAFESIMITMGSFHESDLVKYFAKYSEDTQAADIELDEVALTELIYEKIKVDMSDFSFSIQASPAGSETDMKAIIRKLWSCRLYTDNTSTIKHVKRGDIIKEGEQYYFVLTGNCDLYHFNSKKKLLRLAVLHEFKKTDPERSAIYGNKDDINNQLKTFAVVIKKAYVVLPYIPLTETDLLSLYWNGEIVEKHLPAKTDGRRLMYSEITNLTRVASVLEPYLSAMIQNMLTCITGIGAADYTNETTKIISEDIESLCLQQ